jgi:tetratricopeptide (TPR) repeat protein
LGDKTAARHAYAAAAKAPPDYCFPARLEEIAILEAAIAANPRDARAPFYLGNLLYDRRRHREAIARWEQAVRLEPGNAVAWRNLGIGCFNVLRQPARARAAYERAFKAAPGDARLLFERDQLWKRLGESPARRLRELEKHPHLAKARDDLSVKLCALYSQTGRPEQALAIVGSRKFQPWEGGEGLTLAQYVRARLLLGRRALDGGDAAAALAQFQSALKVPENLGEAKHLLANQSDIYYWMGVAYEKLGEQKNAEEWWRRSTRQKDDLQQMSVRSVSERSYWSALAQQRLGEYKEAAAFFRIIYDYSCELEATEPNIPYFATSLPTMLLFDEDLHRRNTVDARYLRAQALAGMGRTNEAEQLLDELLKLDRNHAGAVDLLQQIRMRSEKLTAN